MKVVDKINQRVQEGKPFFSFEFFPPRTEEGVENLLDRLDRMAALSPVFCDITWGAGGSTADVTLDIAVKMQNLVCVETMMHLTCTNMPEEKLASALQEVKAHGVQNILALRGDPPKGQDKFEAVEGGFACALDLVRYIRREFGDYFGITVAGYPEAHPDGIVEDPEQMDKNYWADIAYLKEKMDAGGEVIITQLFYDVDIFLKFVADCRSVGITAPILPGIMPLMTYAGFKRMTGFCKTRVPAAVSEALEAIKDNEEAVRAYGIDMGADMCRRLLDAGTPGVHLYTLNTDRTSLAILERVGLVDTSKPCKSLPWRVVPPATRRAEEGVRPVFWANRPKAYIKRTEKWEAFPAGRWADAGSPAYGALTDHQFVRRHTGGSATRRDKARAAWGEELASLDDVKAVFAKYLRGEISHFPWSELEDLHSESAGLTARLLGAVDKGLLPINSQPAVNGEPSTHAVHGWGGPGGYVYQKAYLEFFVSPEGWAELKPQVEAAPSLTYLAASEQGEVETNMGPQATNAVTWGVFPGREVAQPTVVCAASFGVWREEAFGLWTGEWGALYAEDSASRAQLADVQRSWVLVSLVDNDYVAGNLFAVLGL